MALLGRWSQTTSAQTPGASWAAPANVLGSTQDRNDSSAYSWNNATSTLTLPSSGLADGYLVIARIEFNGTTNRCNEALRCIQASGTGNFVSGRSTGYVRDANNDNGYITSWGFLDSPSASATIQVQWKRDANANTDGTYSGSIDVIPLYYADAGLYESTTTFTNGGTTRNTSTLDTTVLEGANITRASNTVTVTGDNKRYLILSGQMCEGVGNARTQRIFGHSYDGSPDLACQTYGYARNTSNDFAGGVIYDILETVTATRTINLTCYRGDGIASGQGGADVDGTSPGSAFHAALAVIELNDSAEVWRSHDSTGLQAFDGSNNLALNAARDTDFSDSASFTQGSTSTVTAQAAMDAFVASNVWAASTNVGSGTRGEYVCEITKNGSIETALFDGDYIRGNQGSQDTFGYAANPAGFVALASSDTVGVSVTQSGQNHATDTQAGTVGFLAINLDTLEGGGAGTDDLTANDIASASSVESSALGQTHALTGSDIGSASSVETAALAQAHGLSATDIASASSVDSSSLGQSHAVTGNDLTVTSTVTEVALGQVHNLSGQDAQAAANVDTPAIGQVHALASQDVTSASQVDTPTVTQVHALTGSDIAAGSTLSAPAIGQQGGLIADELTSASSVGVPALGQAHVQSPQDIACAATLEAPALGQAHALTPNEIASPSTVSSPALGEIGGLVPQDIGADSSISQPVLGQIHELAAQGIAAATSVESPALSTQAGVTNLTGLSLVASSSVSAPSLGQSHGLAAAEIAAQPQTSAPTLGQAHGLSASEISATPTVALGSLSITVHITGQGLEAGARLDVATFGQAHALNAVDITAASIAGETFFENFDHLTSSDIAAGARVGVPHLGQIIRAVIRLAPVAPSTSMGITTEPITTHESATTTPKTKPEAARPQPRMTHCQHDSAARPKKRNLEVRRGVPQS